MNWRILALFLLFFCLPLKQAAAAVKMWEEGWVFSPSAGIAIPDLSAIYDKVFVAPFSGQSEILVDLPEDAEGSNAYPIEEFLIENELPSITAAPEVGLEFRRNFGRQNDFYIGISTWEIGSSATVNTVFPLQGELDNQAIYERRAKFSYTQYYLGLRHYLYPRKQKYNLFLNMGLHEIFDVDYKETHVFEFLTGPPAGFKRVVTYQSQATGLLMMQFGLGLEARLGERFSVSAESAFAFGVNDGTLKGIDVRNDFNEGDRLQRLPMPIGVDPATNDVTVLSPDGVSRETVDLNLDGWRFALKLNVAF